MVGGAGSGPQELTDQNSLESVLKRQTLRKGAAAASKTP